MKKFNRNAGITLIALVIIIIVLLILAGVTIATLTGPNGILTQAQKAKEKTEEASLEEKIKLLTGETIINQYSGENNEKTAQDLQEELNKQGENVLVIQWDKYIIFDLDKNKEYRVMSDGTTRYWGENNLGNTLKNFTNTDTLLIGQDSDGNRVIGIDYKGNQVNMNYWESTFYNGTYALNDMESLTSEDDSTPGYLAEIKDGKILGEIPQYIKKEGEEEWIAVTDLTQTFRNLKQLTIMPELPKTAIILKGTFCDTDITEITEIPEGVVDMYGTFGGCTNLEISPELPDTIKDMTSTFYGCSKLREIPTLPNSLEKLNYAFSGCIGISSVNNLPDSIINMHGAFENCSNLTYIGNLPTNVQDMQVTFSNCSKLETVPDIPNNVENLRLTFLNCTALQISPKILSNKVIDMQTTFSGCSSITIAPEIPHSVENMHGTFENCTALITPPTNIPEKVKTLAFTFKNCTNLKGEIEINASINGSMTENEVVDYHECFYNACKNGKLTILNSSKTPIEMLNKLKDNNPNIVIQN